MAEIEKLPATVCPGLEQDLVLYYYQDLDENNRRRIDDHLTRCESCAFYLKTLGALLPQTIPSDEPPAAFWDEYGREMRRKLEAAQERGVWSGTLKGWFRSWLVPVIATAAVVVLTFSFTIGKGFWSSNEVPSDDQALMEALPVAENLEFFNTMDVLDDMDFLEYIGTQARDAA